MADSTNKEVQKANELLSQHPDVQNSAGKYFTFDKNPVVRETWPQGDVQQPTLNPNEVTGQDLHDLGGYAIGVLDPRVLASDKDVAYEEAARKAVDEKDGGRYAGRLNSKMIDLVITAMEQLKPKAQKIEDLNTKITDMAKAGLEADGKGEDLAAEQGLYLEPMMVEPSVGKTAAGIMDLKGVAQHARRDNSLQKITQEARKLSDANADRLTDVIKAVEKGTKGKTKVVPPVKPKPGKKKAAELVAMIDKVAASLQKAGHLKLASELDVVSNTLESLGEV